MVIATSALVRLPLLTLLVVQALAVVHIGPRNYGQLDSFSELRAQLSPGAELILPSDPQMTEVSQRWQNYARPTYSAVVEVAEENDVQVTVAFANNHSMPFLAVGGAHGFTSSLQRMKSGIAISFRKMKGITLDKGDDRYAHFQPGVTNGDVLRGLWKLNKHAVTARCLCTGVTGIMLGGGHGILQGMYGLLADQMDEVRVVLADGSLVTASSRRHDDLFWALRGAGHNFGIVTSIKYRVHDNGASFNWVRTDMMFKQDKLEQYFTALNRIVPEDKHPARFIHWTTFIKRPDIDPVNAILNIYFMYQGTAAELEKLTAPFRYLNPVLDVTSIVTYPGLYDLDEEANEQVCQKGWNRIMQPVLLEIFNITAQREVYGIFNAVLQKYPSTAGGSTFLMEGYSTQGVTAAPDRSTAFSFRDKPLLLSPVIAYTDSALSDPIIEAVKKMRHVLVQATESKKLHAYLNYAFGDETLPELYGDKWRLEKLGRLKEKYDPQGRFNFYSPL